MGKILICYVFETVAIVIYKPCYLFIMLNNALQTNISKNVSGTFTLTNKFSKPAANVSMGKLQIKNVSISYHRPQQIGELHFSRNLHFPVIFYQPCSCLVQATISLLSPPVSCVETSPLWNPLEHSWPPTDQKLQQFKLTLSSQEPDGRISSI